MTATLTVPQDVLERFGLTGAEAAPLGAGLINHTWLIVTPGGQKLVLQRVNAIFPPAVNDDIAVVTQHLAAAGLETPTLVPARDGALWVESEGNWRVLTHIAGTCRNALENAAQAREVAVPALHLPGVARRRAADLVDGVAARPPEADDVRADDGHEGCPTSAEITRLSISGNQRRCTAR